jgi:HEAT repeat protein
MGEEEEQAKHLDIADVYNHIATNNAHAIILMGKAAIPGLVSILERGESWKKRIAIDILEKIEGQSSIRALKVAARDDEYGIRSLAVEALGKKKGKVAEKAIASMRDDPSRQIAMDAKAILNRRNSEPPPGARERNGNKQIVRS